MTTSFSRLIPFGGMGEHKANHDQPKRLLLRLQWPSNEPMVVEVDLERDFLERVWKLMLICEKIGRTMYGRAQVTIQNGRGNYVSIQSEAVVRRLVAMARMKEWSEVHCLSVRDDFLLGNIGRCLGLAGLRSQTVIDQDELWFEGSDMSGNQFVSARLTRDWEGTQSVDGLTTDLARVKLDLSLPLVIFVLDLLPVPAQARTFHVGAFRILRYDAFHTEGQGTSKHRESLTLKGLHVDQPGMLFYDFLEAILSLRKRHLPKVLPIETYQIENVIDYRPSLCTAIHQPFETWFALFVKRHNLAVKDRWTL